MLVVPAVLALGAVAGLADIAGGERIDRAARHLHPAWLMLCLGGELLAYAGYVLMVRDTAKVDNGPSLSFGRSLQTVVGGFGVFAATRTTGGFAVDYWALRSAGEDRDGAVARVLALGALEYAMLAPAALCSAIAILVSGEDVPLTLTLPWLLVIPGALVAVWVTSPKRAPRYSKAARRRPHPPGLRARRRRALDPALDVRRAAARARARRCSGRRPTGPATSPASGARCSSSATRSCRCRR